MCGSLAAIHESSILAALDRISGRLAQALSSATLQGMYTALVILARLLSSGYSTNRKSPRVLNCEVRKAHATDENRTAQGSNTHVLWSARLDRIAPVPQRD